MFYDSAGHITLFSVVTESSEWFIGMTVINVCLYCESICSMATDKDSTAKQNCSSKQINAM